MLPVGDTGGRLGRPGTGEAQAAGPSWAAVSLHPYDDLASLHGKLEQSPQATQLLVVIPKETPLGQRPLAYKVLRRYAEQRGKRLYIVAEDSGARRLARQEGLAVFASLGSLPLGPTEREHLGAILAPEDHGIWLTRPAGRSFRVLFFFALSFLGLFGFLLWELLPGAEVVLTPQSRTLSDTITVSALRAQGDINVADRLMPAFLLEAPVESSEVLTATLRPGPPDQYAVGLVTFINRTDREVRVPRATSLSTGGGVQFITAEEVRVPGGVSNLARVPLVATQAGGEGNVGRLTINQILDPQLALQLTVLNENPTTGGSQSSGAPLAQEDLEALRARHMARLRAQAPQILAQKNREGRSFYRQAITLAAVGESFDPPLEERRLPITYTLRGKAVVLALEGSTVHDLARSLVQRALEPKESLVPGSLRTQLLEAVAWDEGQVSFRVALEARAVPQISREEVREALRGMGTQEALAYLGDLAPQAQPPQVALFPGWVTALPQWVWRIQVQVRSEG